MASGIPLARSSEVIPGAIEIFKKDKINVIEYYYLGEFIVRHEYRNQGIFSRLFFEACEISKNLGYKNICLMTVDREDQHPLKPSAYRNTDELWKKLGFFKTNLKLIQEWPTIMVNNQINNKHHSLSFWIKDIV
jgi:hypothetical protein